MAYTLQPVTGGVGGAARKKKTYTLQPEERSVLIGGATSASSRRMPVSRLGPIQRGVYDVGQGIASGVSFGLLRGEEPVTPDTLGTVLQTGGAFAGMTVSPVGRVLRFATAPLAARVANIIGRGRMPQPAFKVMQQMVQSGQEGALFSLVDSVAHDPELFNLARRDPVAATLRLAKSMTQTGAQWAAFGGTAGLAGQTVSAIRARNLTQRDIRRLAQIKKEQVGEMQSIWGQFEDGSPRPEPKTVRIMPGGIAYDVQRFEEEAQKAYANLQVIGTQGRRAEGTSPRQIGINPRNVAKVAVEEGITAEAAQEKILRAGAYREARGKAMPEQFVALQNQVRTLSSQGLSDEQIVDNLLPTYPPSWRPSRQSVKALVEILRSERGSIGRPEVEARWISLRDGQVRFMPMGEYHTKWAVKNNIPLEDIVAGGAVHGGKVNVDSTFTRQMPRSNRPLLTGIRQSVANAWMRLKDETGFIDIDLVTGGLLKSLPLKQLVMPGAERKGVAVWGARQMMHGARRRAAWEQSMAESLPNYWPGIDTAMKDKLYNLSTRMFQAVVSERIGKRPAFTGWQEAWAKGEGGQQWYTKLRPELREAFPMFGEDDIELLLKLAAVTSKGSSVKGNLGMTVKAFTQIKTGKPISGHFLANPEVRAIAEGQFRSGPKVSNFLIAGRENTPEEMMAVAQSAMKGEVAFTAPENAVVLDRRMGWAFGKRPAEATQTWKGASMDFSDTEYAVYAEDLRQAARDLTSTNWKKVYAKYQGAVPPIQEIVDARVTPRDLQAAVWITEGMKKGEYSGNLTDVLRQRPDLVNQLLMVSKRTEHTPAWMGSDPATMQAALQRETYAIIGTNPGEGLKPKLRAGEDGEMALLRMAAKAGYSPDDVVFIRGVWQGQHEPTLLIRNMPEEQAIKFGKELGQSAVITNKGLIDLSTGKQARFTGKVEWGTKNPEGYSVVRTPMGDVDFRMEFDFNQEIVHPAFRTRTQQLLIAAQDMRGAINPGPIKMKFDPKSGKFVVVGAAPGQLGPNLRAYTEQVERQFQAANIKQTIVTGEPIREPSATVDPATGEIKPSWEDKLAEFGAAAKVFGVRTNQKNILSAIFTTMMGPVQRFTAGSADFILSAGGKLRPRERFASEAFSEVSGMWSSIHSTSRNAVRLLNEMGLRGALNKAWEAGAIAPQFMERAVPRKAIGGKVGEVIRTPFRLLGMSDAYWSEINRGGIIRAHALRQALKEGADDVAGRATEIALNPTKEMSKQVISEINERMFRKEGGWLLEAAYKARSFPGGRIMFPFVRVTSNIVTYVTKRSPLGLLELRPGQTAENMEVLGRVATGAMLGMGLTALALNGYITGNGPNSRSQREMLEKTGWMPNSVKIGDTWISYQGIEPLASFLRFAGEFAEYVNSDEELEKKIPQFVKSLAVGVLDNAFTGQLFNLYEQVFGDYAGLRSWQRAAAGQVTGFIPTAMKEIGREIDPTVRRAENFLEMIQDDLPGLMQRLPAKLDVYGQPVMREGTEFLPKISAVKDDPLSLELVRLGVTLPRPAKTFTKRGEPVKRTMEDIDALQTERGRAFRGRLTTVIQSPGWDRLTDGQKKARLESWIDAIVARQRGR